MVPRFVYALVGDLFFATKIVKTAQAVGLEARAFDSADRLLKASLEKAPALVIMDCERLEKEAFRLLDGFRVEGGLSGIPRIGYLSHGARDLKQEMCQAGCLQVYFKSEFTKELENILGRYGHGFSSRV
jgi:hypothetical protein